METEVILTLAGRKKKVNKVNTKLDMLPRSTWWKEGPKSKAPWDIQVWFFVILEMHRIDFNSLVLILLIYLWEKKKLVCLFYPHFLDAYVLPILTILKIQSISKTYQKLQEMLPFPIILKLQKQIHSQSFNTPNNCFHYYCSFNLEKQPLEAIYKKSCS